MTLKQQTGEESSEVRQLSHRPAESGQRLSPSASHRVQAEMQLGVTSKSTPGCPPTDNHNQPPPRRWSSSRPRTRSLAPPCAAAHNKLAQLPRTLAAICTPEPGSYQGPRAAFVDHRRRARRGAVPNLGQLCIKDSSWVFVDSV